MPDSTQFAGFSEPALAFLSGLAADNSRSFFETNQDVYKRDLQAAMRSLVDDLGLGAKATISAGLQAEPKVGKSLFRINRDLRFSKDKTPYNPWVDAVFWEGPDSRRSPSLILRITGDSVITGAGIMGMTDQRLESYRRAVAATDTGEALDRLLFDIPANPQLLISEPRWARVPGDYPSDHPRSALLRCDTLHASVQEPPPPEIASAAFTEWLLDRYQRFAPLHRWLVEAIG